MVRLLFLLLLSLHAHAGTLRIDEAWSGVSNPLLMSKNFETRYFLLPLTGQVRDPQKFWSGDYWAMRKGNINFRWHAKEGFDRSSPSLGELRTMTIAEIAQLSPAEKFDILNGRYLYPLKKEVQRLTSYAAKDWEGICHGWAPASMNHNEPQAKTLRNRDGIKIPFGSSDIKAILSYYYAYPYQVWSTHQVGRRCDQNIFNQNENCKEDMNAGAFHIILTNRVGLENKGFIADMDRFQQVWNHPIMGYEARVTHEGRGDSSSAPGTFRTVRFRTTITYADESINSWYPLLGTGNQKTVSQRLDYTVEVSERGEVIGGEWNSAVRPDFLWIKDKPTRFTGNFVQLADLLND